MQKIENINSFSLMYSDKSIHFEILSQLTKNKRMLDVLKQAKNFSALPDPLLIVGETGVGKNMLAQAIHNEKQRQGFHEVTCSGISEHLFESEIFGHEAGAFTGALSKRDGLARKAHGGTLFLDEIGEISLELQAKLLRLIEQKCFYPVGSDVAVKTDIHILCATNKNLSQLTDQTIFRSDLFYRMPLIIKIPSLRERPEDLEQLVKYFFTRYRLAANNPHLQMTDEVLDILKNYNWPGNIRELKYVMKIMVYAAMREQKVSLEHLPEWVDFSNVYAKSDLTLKCVEKKHIMHVLDLVNGDKSKAAKLLGIGRNTLYRKIDEWKTHDLTNDKEKEDS